MTPEVEQAVEELKSSFPESRIETEAESQGGAHVTVHDLSIGDQYIPAISWVSFTIGFQYPNADVYPHFFDKEIKRKDNEQLGEGFSIQKWQEKDALQVSRKSNNLDPLTDTAATKLLKVLEWVRSR